MLLSSSDTKRTLMHSYSCLQIPPRENWFQYVRRVYTTAINFPCITSLPIPMFKLSISNLVSFYCVIHIAYDKQDMVVELSVQYCRDIFENSLEAYQTFLQVYNCSAISHSQFIYHVQPVTPFKISLKGQHYYTLHRHFNKLNKIKTPLKSTSKVKQHKNDLL